MVSAGASPDILPFCGMDSEITDLCIGFELCSRLHRREDRLYVRCYPSQEMVARIIEHPTP
jgi:hypothetical protein